MKTIYELAIEVIDGKWGNGDTRKKRLTEAGYDYYAVQAKVNEIIEKRELMNRLAAEVLGGKWGNGDDRKRRLEEAGYVYDDVQNRVNEILKVAQEVIDGKWGNSDERKRRLTAAGYDYDVVQSQVNKIIESQTSWIDRANAWAKMIADCNDFHYVKWKKGDKATQTCPICTKRVVLDAVYDAVKKVFKFLGIKINCERKYVGWNCIGFSFAVWHHGGGLPCKCSDGVIANEIWEKILNAKTDAEALALAQKHVGLKELKVIRNKNGIPKSQWKAGDIMGKFNGEKYIHTFYYMGNGKIAESTGSSGKIPVNEQIRIKSYDKTSAKVIVRYTGK